MIGEVCKRAAISQTTFRQLEAQGIVPKFPSKSALHRDIKQIDPQTWETVHAIVIAHAQRTGVEDGIKVRTDCTVMETTIHHPNDSSLLWDCVRELTRPRMAAFDLSTEGSQPELQRGIYFGGLGVSRGRRHDELVAISGSLSLLCNLAMAWMTNKLQGVLDDRHRAGRPVPGIGVLRHIGPVHSGGINFRGRFHRGRGD